MSPAGNPANSIRSAVSRLGFNLVRLTAMSHAMQQLEKQKALAPIRNELAEIYRASSEVAAICYVIAKRAFGRQPDEAMLAGLLHAIGSLYILTHAQQVDPELRKDPGFRAVVQDWQPVLGKAILDSWGVPARIGLAVASQDDLLGVQAPDADPVARLLSAAKMRYRLAREPRLRDERPGLDELMRSLQIGTGNFLDLVASSHNDIEEMQQLLAA